MPSATSKPMTRPCRCLVDGSACPYPQLILPGGRHSTYCYWHRLARTSMDAQIREAGKRLDSVSDQAVVSRVSPREWPDGERWCAGCQGFVPLFYTSTSRCLACASQGARTSRRLSVYGLTQDSFSGLAELQNDRCAICRKRQVDRSIAVDHNHQTGEVRGLLCKRCNHDLLGAAYESVKILLAAATYLIAPPSSGNWIDPEDGGDVVLKTMLSTVAELARVQEVRRRTPQEQREMVASQVRP